MQVIDTKLEKLDERVVLNISFLLHFFITNIDIILSLVSVYHLVRII